MIDCTHIPYNNTGFFSKLATDYVAGFPEVQPFYEHEVSLEGIQQAIKNRRQFATDRKLLHTVLKEQYKDVAQHSLVKHSIELLKEENTFTVTTAHQPNIFTGPLYFIYKILHTIKLAQRLAIDIPSSNFVPVYYMGSEDADLDELNHITIEGTKYTWNTNQTGPVGRMKIDKELIALLDKIYGQVGVHPYGKEIIDLLKKYYVAGATVQQATLQVVNELFGQYGLIIIIPDNALLKRRFENVIQKELKEEFSHKVVAQTLEELSKHYKVQAAGRELNLFYLIDDKRERIEKDKNDFVVNNLQLRFSPEKIINELKKHPERFSANVILRGIFQETVLPNIAFIGGGGELAYWLELKNVFAEVEVPYPLLLLRNSFLLIEKKWKEKADELQLEITQLFASYQTLSNTIVKRRSNKQLTLADELQQLKANYTEIEKVAINVDSTLSQHVASIQLRAEKLIQELEKKMLRAEKHQYEAELRQLQTLKSALFPNDSLQERVENIISFYARHGRDIVDLLLKNSLTIEQEFVAINL